MFHRTFAILIVVALSGGGIAADATAASPFDGVYRGTQQAIKSNNSGDCAKVNSDNIVLRIQNGHFTRQWYTALLNVSVAPDGSFDQTAMISGGRATGAPRAAQIKGHITGNKLEADIGSDYCAVHLSLMKG